MSSTRVVSGGPAHGIITGDVRNLFRTVGPQESTSSQTFVDLPTYGPEVLIRVPTSGCLLIAFSVNTYASGGVGNMSAGVYRASDNALRVGPDLSYSAGTSTNNFQVIGCSYLAEGLTPGELVRVLAKYRNNGGGTAYFSNRTLSVLPIAL